MNFQDGRRRGGDGVAAVIDFLLSNARLVLGVGGAAVLGIATLAVKRLIERAGRAAAEEEEEKVKEKMAESWEELSLVRSSPGLIEGVVLRHVTRAAPQHRGDLCQPADPPPALEPPPRRSHQGAAPLKERLQRFYESRVVLSSSEVQRAQVLALDICAEVQGFLHARRPDMPLGEMSLGGSLLDDLQVVCADHVCLLVPLQLDVHLWRLVPGEETLLTHPLHWMVRRVNLEYYPRGQSYWDRFLVGGYLSAEAVVNMFTKEVMETLHWPSISSSMDCSVRPLLGGAQLRLEIRAGEGGGGGGGGDEEPPLFITMLPVLRQDQVVLTAQPERTSPWVNAWLLSLYPWETQRLLQLDAADGGCRRRALKILKAACRLNPALRPLPAAALANLVLHLSQGGADWSAAALDARVLQCVTEMIGFLERGVLPSFFRPGVNLLGALTEEQVERAGFMLYCAVTEPQVLLM